MLIRLKLQLASHSTRMIAISVLVGVLLISGAGYVYLTPSEVTLAPEQEEVFEIESEISHGAVVQDDSPLFEVEDELENQPVYFTNITPELDIDTSTTVNTPDGQIVNVTQRLYLEEEAIWGDITFWSNDVALGTNQTILVEEGANVQASLDIGEIQSRSREIESVLGGTANMRLSLRLETIYETQIEGDTYEGRMLVTPEMDVGTSAYRVEDDLSESTTETRTIPRGTETQSPSMSLIGALLLLGGGALAGGGAIAWKARELDEEELRLAAHRQEYSDWISQGELIVNPDSQYIYVHSLKDLVNIGIDTDKRVIYDPSIEAYTVADGDIVYYFTENRADIEPWMDL